MQCKCRHRKQSVDLSAAFVIIEALQAVLVVPECILIACLVRPSTAAGVARADLNDLSDSIEQDARSLKEEILSELNIDEKLEGVSQNAKEQLDSGLGNLSEKLSLLEESVESIQEDKVPELSDRISNLETNAKTFEDEMKEKVGNLVDEVKDIDAIKEKVSSDIEQLLQSRDELLVRIEEQNNSNNNNDENNNDKEEIASNLAKVEEELRSLIDDTRNYF